MQFGCAARVCQNCGEEYVDDAVASEFFRTAATTARSGAEFDVRHYLKAAWRHACKITSCNTIEIPDSF
jgi:hypothetical protein